MGALLPLLLALNIVVASVATPTFVSGLGLGSGATGSSFKQEVKKSSPSDVKAATTILNLSCDKDIWNKTKTADEPAYPESEDDFKKLFDQAQDIGSTRFDELCKAHDEGKSGIVFLDPLSMAMDNGVEMFHLFSSHWDKRSLAAIYYLYEKRFTSKGFDVDCSYEGKTAPIMTLSVAASYMDDNGQPTAVAQSGLEDDKAATDSRSTFSSHSRGQGVDVRTFGCTIITGDEPQVIANNLAIGQSDKAEISQVTEQALAAATNSSAQASPEVQEGLAEIKEGNSTLFTAGLDAAERAGLGPVQIAADFADPDAEPELMVHNDPPADLTTATGATIPELSKQAATKLSFEDRAAQMLERAYEKQQGLPAGSLRDGAKLETIGKKALYDQAGIALGENPTPEEVAAAVAALSAHQNSDVATLIPASAINQLKSGNYQMAAKIIGASRLNASYNLGFSDTKIASMAQSGVSSDELISYIESNRTMSETEKDQLRALTAGGYAALRSKLDEAQAQKDSSVAGKFLIALKGSPALNETQRIALNDFLTKKEFRSGVAQRMSGTKAIQTIIDWVNQNQNISDEDAKGCKEIFDVYSSSSDYVSALDKAYPSVYASTISSSTNLMKPEEKAIFQSVFGANPTPKELEEGFENGKLEQASEAYIFSRGLQKIGLSAAQASYLGVGLAQDRLNGTDVGLAKINQEVGKKWGVTLTKQDLTLFKNGNFAAGKKLALGAIASKSKLPVQKVVDYFSKKDYSSASAISSAFSSNPKLGKETKEMLDGMLGSDTSKGVAASAYAGAKAKARAIATSSAEGSSVDQAEKDRQTTSDKVEKALDKALDKGKAAAQDEGRNILTAKGLNNKEADAITSGQVKGAEKVIANSIVAKKIVSQLPPGTVTIEGVKSVLAGRSTAAERDALRDNLVNYELAQQHIYYSGTRSITDTLMHGTEAERQALLADIGKQSGANALKEVAEANNIPISREQALEFMNNDFSQLGNVAGQTLLANGFSRITNTQISGEAASALYSALTEAISSSPRPTTTYPTTTSNVGIDPSGSNSGDAAFSNMNNDPTSDVPSNLSGEPGVAVDNENNNISNANNATNAGKDTLNKVETPENKLENLGWGVVEDQLGFSRDAIVNLQDNVQNLPNNIVDYYKNFDYNATLSNIATGVILNKLVGNTLAKIDPTGGILTSIAMNYAATWIASLGISMPILLGISLLIDFKSTIQAIKGLVIMALQIFTDPVGFIMGFLGFGKKKPKAQSAAKNAVKAAKDDTLDGKIVDAPIEQPAGTAPEGGTYVFAPAIVYAADDKPSPVSASSAYLAPKKPSEEQFKKISRRTVDQVAEDLLLYSLAASSNRELTKTDTSFLKKHWSNFMDIENPKNGTYAIKQLISPRAVITSDEVEAAKKLGITDALYAKESSEPMVGYRQIVNYARLLYGEDFLPSKTNKRVSGLMQNRSIKTHVHFGF